MQTRSIEQRTDARVLRVQSDLTLATAAVVIG